MKLIKSEDDKMLFGVCGGIASYLGWDSTIVRLVFVLGTLLVAGTFALVYFILAILMPQEKEDY